MTDVDALKEQAWVAYKDRTARYVERADFEAGWDALLEALGGDQHLLKLEVSGDYREWTIQHPVSERIDGALFECAFTVAGSTLVQEIPESGTYRLWKDRSALLWEPVT
jgi:hypothetical protein